MFERCYLAAFAISLVSTVLLWSSLNEQFGAQELLLGGWFLPTVTVIGFAVPLLSMATSASPPIAAGIACFTAPIDFGIPL